MRPIDVLRLREEIDRVAVPLTAYLLLWLLAQSDGHPADRSHHGNLR